MSSLLPLPSSVLGHVAQSYRRTAVQTAGPAQLIVEVHDAALESFPASDAPSWGALRVGPPVGDRFVRAAA